MLIKLSARSQTINPSDLDELSAFVLGSGKAWGARPQRYCLHHTYIPRFVMSGLILHSGHNRAPGNIAVILTKTEVLIRYSNV